MDGYPRETSDNGQEMESSGEEELEFKFNPDASLIEKLEFVELVNKSRSDHAEPAILVAAEWADAEVCEELVKQGADVNVTDKYGNDVYQCAALNTRERGLELIDFFKDHGAKMERRNENGRDAVIQALRYSDFEFAIKLFNCYESRPESSKSFISHCILQDLLFLKFAFEKDPSVFKVKNSDEIDRRITYDGASSANLEKFEWIVEVTSRIDEDLVKSKEWQLEILMYAALNAKYGEEIARFMFSDHIKNDDVTREEWTDLIVRVMSSDLLQLVNFEVVKMLVQRGANLNNVRIEGNTLFDHCVTKGSIQAAQFVYNLNLNSTKIGVDTLLMSTKNLEMFEWLVDRPIDPDMMDLIPYFHHCFFKMGVRDFAEISAPILRSHVNVLIDTYDPPLFPLQAAMVIESLEAAETLLEIGADLNVKYQGVLNLLLYCLGINYLDGAKFVYSRDKSQLYGKFMDTALMITKKLGNEEMKQWLNEVLRLTHSALINWEI